MLNSPVRNLLGGVLFVLTVGGLAVVAYSRKAGISATRSTWSC
jgi:hypothetical protein